MRKNQKLTGKKIGAGLLLAAMAAGLISGCGGAETAQKKSIRIGVALYRADDTFIDNLRLELEKRAKEYEQETGIKVILDIESAKGSQSTQNQQIERLISLECDVICINPVDRMAVSTIIDDAMDSDTPLVFFNRQPADEDMNRWNKLSYVGIDARETAMLQGQIVIDHYLKDPDAFDENGDGVVKYVLLEGESSHQDSLIRTEVSIETLMNADIPIERLTGGIANWQRSQASALMEKWLEEYPDEIELVISNNDDMALGAIDALERAGNDHVEVVGIDATQPGLEAVSEGKMIGTVANDTEAYSRAVFSIAVEQAGEEVTGEHIELTDGKYYWCMQSIINDTDF